MNLDHSMLAVTIILFLVSVFFLFFALASFFYPRSLSTVEAYPEGVRTPRRWRPILVQTALCVLAAAAGTCLFNFYFMPDISAQAQAEQLADAEAITRSTFRDKLGLEPDEITFDGDDPRNGLQQFLKLGWKRKGVARLGNAVWDVTVTQTGMAQRTSFLNCEAKPRQ